MLHHSIELTTPTASARRPSRRRLSAWQLILTLGALLLLGFFALTQWPHYAGTSVCQECGMRRDYFDWTLRSSQVSLHRFSKDSPTALSRALTTDEAIAPQPHRWTEIAQTPEASSESQEISPNLLYPVESLRVAHFAGDLSRYTQADVVTKWKALLLDPRYSTVWEGSLRFMRYPEAGFPDASKFQLWWRQTQFPLWNHLRELTEPD